MNASKNTEITCNIISLYLLYEKFIDTIMLPSPIELSYFYEVTNSGSFSDAARKLNVSQPSLSLAVKKLEDRIGKRLFLRHKQGISLTASGKILYDHVKELIDKWSCTLHAMRDAHNAMTGSLTISCNSTLAPFISNLLADLMKTHSGLKIHLVHAPTPMIIKNLAAGLFDLGIVIDPPLATDLVLNKLGHKKFSFWSKADGDNVQTNNRLIICDPDLPQTQRLLSMLRANFMDFELSRCNQLESIAALVASGCGIGILPSCFVEEFFKDRLKEIKQYPYYFSTMYIAYHMENQKMMAIQTVKNTLVEMSCNNPISGSR